MPNSLFKKVVNSSKSYTQMICASTRNKITPTMLSKEVKKVMKENNLQIKKVRNFDKISIKNIYFMILLFIVIIVFNLAFNSKSIKEFIIITVKNSDLSFVLETTKSIFNFDNTTLINVQIGVISVIIALLFFIANKNEEKMKILLRRTFVFPITIASLLTLFIFIWSKDENSVILVVPIFCIVIALIFSLKKTFEILTSKKAYREERVNFIDNVLRTNIKHEIEKRISDNYVLKLIYNNELLLNFNYFVDKSRKFYYLKAKKEGIVSDINISELKLLANKLEKIAIKNGFTWFADAHTQETLSYEGANNTNPSESKEKELKKNNNRFLFKLRFQSINETNNRILIALEKKLFTGYEKEEIEMLLKSLEKHANNAFIIKPEIGTEEIRKEAKDELSSLKDQFSKALSQKLTREIVYLKNIYIDLLNRVFIGYIGSYSSQAAIEEKTSIFGRWKTIEWIIKDIFEIYKRSLKTHDSLIIEAVEYFPIHIALESFKERDHYLFQEFLKVFILHYEVAIQIEGNENLQESMIEKSWMFLKEIADYHIEIAMKKEASIEVLNSLKDYSLYLIEIIQTHLKISIDKNRKDDFEKFLKLLKSVFCSLNISKKHPHGIDDLKWKIKYQQDDDKKAELNEELKNKLEIAEIEQQIQDMKNMVVFGIAGWIIYQAENSKEESDRNFYIDLFNETLNQLPSDFKTLTNVYYKIIEQDTKHSLSWSTWYIKTDIGKRFMQGNPVQDFIDDVFTIKILHILNNNTDIGQEALKIEPKRDFDIYVSKSIERIKKKLSGKNKVFEFILTQSLIHRFEKLEELKKKIKLEQQKNEREEIKAKCLDISEIQDFQNRFTDSFRENSTLRCLLKTKKIDYLTNKVDETANDIGINTLASKEVFFKNWHVHYIGYGDDYGRSLAQGENNIILKEVLKHCSESKIESFAFALKDIKDTNGYVLFITHDDYNTLNKNDTAFIRPWRIQNDKYSEVPFFYGREKTRNIPVFVNRNSNEFKGKIVVFNINKIKKIIQLSPVKDPTKETDRFGDNNMFSIETIDLSLCKKSRSELLKQKLDWLKEYGNKDEQIEHLKQNVWIKIFECFKVEFEKDFEGYIFNLKDQ